MANLPNRLFPRSFKIAKETPLARIILAWMLAIVVFCLEILLVCASNHPARLAPLTVWIENLRATQNADRIFSDSAFFYCL